MHKRINMVSQDGTALMPHSFSYILPPGEGFVVGDFQYDVLADAWHWSTGVYTIHGFEPGDIVPTTPLVLAHKHPNDREAFEVLFHGVRVEGGTVVSHHRIIDGHGGTRKVVMIAEGRKDPSGNVDVVTGHFLDLTNVIERESSAEADEAVARAVEKRQFIEQAKGILMGRFSMDSDSAFEILVKWSQREQRKVRDIAVDLVKRTCEKPPAPEATEK